MRGEGEKSGRQAYDVAGTSVHGISVGVYYCYDLLLLLQAADLGPGVGMRCEGHSLLRRGSLVWG